MPAAVATVLIIDDEEKLRSLLRRILGLEGYQVSDTGSLKNARQMLEANPADIVLCDVKLPDGNGVDFTHELKQNYPRTEIILLTAYGNIPDGIQAIRNGAFDYIVKGDDNDKIIPLLARVAEKAALHKKVAKLEQQLGHQVSFDNIIGNSAEIRDAIQLARKVAPTGAAVLLNGETGTGKEVFAQAIHRASAQAGHSFVALNCSAFSKDLLESELFGHKAGAFTGATRDKKGLVDEANGGTLFLDEIGEMPLELQPKLLRLLENGAYLRVGDTREMHVSLRIIAASNRDLKMEIAKEHFRSDLYYRIAVFRIDLPALRNRKGDIPLLAAHFLNYYASRMNKRISAIAPEALLALENNEWKGNVRELKNVLERAVILEDGSTLGLDTLPLDIRQCSESGTPPDFHMSTMEKMHIIKMLHYTHGNKTEAARLLDIGLATLYRKIEEYGIR